MSLTQYQQKVLNYEKHISLTANAGSGKTFIFAKRYVQIAFRDDVSLNEIVAITFTEKAASELYKRISKEIEELKIIATPDELKKIQRLRRQLVSANISTIHSFCINLLKEYPVEAGIDANFSIIDNYSSNELINQVVEEYVNSGLKNNDAILKKLIRTLNGKKNFLYETLSMLKSPKIFETVKETFGSKSVEEITSYFEQLFDTDLNKYFPDEIKRIVLNLKTINNVVLTQGYSEIAEIVKDKLITIENEENLKNIITVISEIKKIILTTSGEIRKIGYIKKYFSDSSLPVETEYLLGLISELNLSNSHKIFEALAEFTYDYIKIVSFIRNIYENRKKEIGVLDFDDMLLLAKKITDNKNVINALNQKFKYIMIDEYQDTDQLQYDIIMPILDNLHSGNLFVVGDEKQSIYKFREAELELFRITKEDIKKSGSEDGILNLPHTFRLSPEIALFVNVVFKKIFSNPDIRYNEVEHNDLICVDQGKSGSISLLVGDENNNLDEAEITALKITEIINKEGKNYKDIAILCRKRTYFIGLEEALSKYSIPYKIVGGKGFYQRQIIYDIINYINFLIHPYDNSALTGILKSPFYLLTDLEILEIRKYRDENILGNIKLLSLLNPKLNAIYHKLNEHLRVKMLLPIDELLRRIFIDTGYLIVISEREESRQELANIEKLISIAANYSTNSYKSLYDFREFLADSIEKIEDENQAEVDKSENCIKILTIHQSKGLEFNTVFLYKTNEKLQSEKVKKGKIEIDKNYGFLTKININDLFQPSDLPPFSMIFEYVENKKNIAEEKRLLYVALTRAVNNLYIVAKTKENGIIENSYLDWILKATQINIENNIHFLRDQLEIMNEENNDVIKPMQIQIQIERDFQIPENNVSRDIESEISFVLNAKLLNDFPKNEIISATKIAVISQCEYKYHLTYDLGYLKLINTLEGQKSEVKENDNDEIKYSDIEGLLIHKLLEKNIPVEKCQEFVIKEIEKSKYNMNLNEKDKESVASNVNKIINKFYDTECYKNILAFSDFKTEYEIYLYENELYLYGIIDKLIFDGSRIIILDYKTDEINDKNIKVKTGHYLVQLSFYGYILNKLYPDKEIILKLVFIKDYSRNLEYIMDRKRKDMIGCLLGHYKKILRECSFSKNFSHCKECHLKRLKIC